MNGSREARNRDNTNLAGLATLQQLRQIAAGLVLMHWSYKKECHLSSSLNTRRRIGARIITTSFDLFHNNTNVSALVNLGHFPAVKLIATPKDSAANESPALLISNK
jgi:hypothetical protein